MFPLFSRAGGRSRRPSPCRWHQILWVLCALAAGPHAGRSATGAGLLLRDTTVDTKCLNFDAYSYGVPTVMGEAFQQDGVATSNGWQYATYYNSARHVCVGRRLLPAGAWEVVELTDYYFASQDSHNDVVLGICPADGTIHLSYDHHNNDLHYRVSVPGVTTNPAGITWSAALFPTPTTSQLVPGSTVTLVTYPCFITTPAGGLLLTVRYGASGGGDQTLYTYDGTTHAWTKNGAFTIRSGTYSGKFTTNGTDRNAYVDWTYFDASGRLHMTWCWRETPDALSNHDLMYAYSDDRGATWNNGAGTRITLTGTSPISIDSPGIVAWGIPQQRGLINNSASCIDSTGIIHVMTWQLPDGQPDETSFSQSLSSAKRFHHYWRGADNVWHRTPTTLTGTRAKIVADDDGRMYLIYGDETNVQVAMATRESGWTDWAPLTLSGALPTRGSSTVNIVIDYARWDNDRVLSVYAQEINPSIPLPGPTPLHVLDYHVSRLAVLPTPANAGVAATSAPTLTWTPGIEAVSNDVYFGSSLAAVTAATTTSAEYKGRVATASYAPGPLSGSTIYYWRVDSVRADGTVLAGRVWKFTTPVVIPLLAPVITSAATATGTALTAFSFQITASNSPTSFSASGLPTGLKVDAATGILAGTPTVAGVYVVTVAATNTAGTGTAKLTLTVQPVLIPAITSAATATGTVGTYFSFQITASNSPASFAVTGLPVGLALDPTKGLLSGSPTVAGVYALTISATNAVGTGTAKLTLTVQAVVAPVLVPVITSAASATGTVGAAFSFQITASNSPTSFAIDSLPNGLALDATTGILSGNPTVAGVYNLTVSATNAAGTGNAGLTLNVQTVVPVATVVAAEPTVPMGGADAFVVTLSAAQPTDTVVYYRLKGSAVNGEDYTMLSGRKRIKAGRTSKHINFTSVDHPGRTSVTKVKFVLAPADTYTVGDPSRAKVKILPAQ